MTDQQDNDDKYVAYVIHRHTAWFCLACAAICGLTLGVFACVAALGAGVVC